MKKTCLITAMILTALISTASYGATPAGPLSVSGSQIVNQYGQPVSFAGMSFFWSNYDWGGERYYNASCLNWLVNDWEVTIVRAAMGVEDDGGYIDKPDFNKGKLKTIVDASIAAGIYVIIDWHSHHAEDYESEAIDFFEEMATTYGGYDNVIYEIYNEPLSGCSWSGDIKPYAEAVIAAIRAIDPDNLIVVGSPEWSQRTDLPAGNPITGYINIAYTLHFYADRHFSTIRNRASNAMADGIALMVTEWGPKSDPEAASNIEWIDWLEANQISHTAWAVNDKNEPWSILDANIGMFTGGWSDSNLSSRGTLLKDLILNWDGMPAPPPPPPELVGRWDLDEDGGSTAEDTSGEGNDGTLEGNPQWVDGQYGSALALDGDDYVDLGNPPVLDFGTDNFTLCAWVKNPGGNNVIAKGGDQSGGIRYCLQVGSSVQLLVDDNSDKVSVSGGSGLDDGQWHHVAGVKDTGTLRVFIDSVEVGDGWVAYALDLSGTSQHNAYIGAVYQHEDNVVGDFHTGTVDDIRIYNGALTSTELAVVMLGCELDAPTGLSATPGEATVSLDWNDNTEDDLADYNVYRSTTSGSGYSQIETDVAISDYVDNTAAGCMTYLYVVTAVDVNDRESGYSNEVFSRPTVSIAPGDATRDCRVNLDDIAQLSGHWLTDEPSSDIAPLPVGDGTVDLLDLAAIVQNWMTRYINTASMVASWQFDEGTGGATVDSSGNNHSGTLTGMDEDDWVDGQYGSALDFDGINDHVAIAGYKGIAGSNPRTCTAWIKTSAIGVIIHWGSSDLGAQWTLLAATGGRLGLAVGGSSVIGSTVITDGEWHHVAVVSDGSNVANIILYVDGDPETPDSQGDLVFDTQPVEDVTIGKWATGLYFSGLIDDVRIYDRVLTDQEINEMTY